LPEERPNQRGEALVEINFRILGRTALRIGDHFDQEWAQPKPRAMLTALLLRPGQAVTIDELVGLMWSDKLPQAPTDTLYHYAKRVREALEHMSDPPKIRVGGGAYRIEADRDKIDFFAFRDMAAKADSLRRQGDHADAATMLAAAVDLWTEPPFLDLHGPRAQNRRLSAEKEHLIPAHGALLTELCALGSFEDVLRRLSDLPMEYQETLTLVKCRLAALRGLHRSQEANTYYLEQRRRLVRDFDQDAATELTRFQDDLLLTRPTNAYGGLVAPNMLPHHISDFIGREDLLAHLDTVAAPVIVLAGEPGVGKTELALHWARQVSRQRFPAGQLYADLRGFSSSVPAEPAEVAETFLVALGYPVARIPSTAGKLARLRSLAADRRLLVILDNAGDPQHIQVLLDCLPGSTVLITSRRRLGGLGPILPVPPLSYREGKALLAQRLGPRGDHEDLGQLTALCGGIALALRVVAEHVNSRPRVPLTDFVEELRDGRTLLGLGDSGYGQDGSVRAAFAHSYRALDPDGQRLFRLLGLNPGADIGLDTAVALAGWERRYTKRVLDILVDAYLLAQPESRERYRFHDLVRKYAQECAADPAYRDECTAAGERLLSFYLHTTSSADMLAFPGRDQVPMLTLADGVQPLSFADADSAIRWIVRERVNLNAIVRFAAASGFHEYATRLPSSIGEIFLRCHYYDDVSKALRIAVYSARNAHDIGREAASLGNLGFIYLTLHDLAMAERCLLPAQAKFDECGTDPHGAAVNLHRIGRLQVEQGRFKEGIQTQLDALVLQRRTGIPGSIIISLYRLAEAYRRAHNFSEAIFYGEAALREAQGAGDRRNEVSSLIELALAHYERGDLAAAKDACGHGLRISAEIHETGQLGRYHLLLALISRDQGNTQEAERISRIAVERARVARDAKSEGTAWETLAEIAYRQAKTEQALDFWTKALAAYEDCHDPRVVTVHARLADSTAFPSSVPTERTTSLGGPSMYSATDATPNIGLDI
jgi:DNA-binding SARP family transcriptional activator/tetratricopeptide (TPR) repeat protein